MGCAHSELETRPRLELDGSASGKAGLFPRRGEDIEILYCWGMGGGRNRLDTISGTITKDLIGDPPITVPFELTDSQKEMIVHLADSTMFWALPTAIEPPDSLAIIHTVMPYSDYLLRITFHISKTVLWDSYSTDPCTERDRAEAIGPYIEHIVTESEAYRQLPPSRGGYL